MTEREAAYIVYRVFNGDQRFTMLTFFEAFDVFLNHSIDYDSLTVSDFLSKIKQLYIED